jgi:hypothetical protein
MGRVSRMEISSHPKISPQEEKPSIPESHGPFGNCIPVKPSQPSDERYRNFSMAIAYIDSYKNINFSNISPENLWKILEIADI